jgi:hypothetical protein
MKNDNCPPYVKISQEQADILAQFSQQNSQVFLLKNKPQEKTDVQTFAGFSLVSKAEAQGTQSPADVFSGGVFDSLTFPFYILFGSFFLFIILMSFVYFYHWEKVYDE